MFYVRSLFPRLCIHLLLSSEWEAVAAFLAIVCSSFVPVNRGSTMRSILTPLGNEEYLGVRRGNKLVARTWVQNCFGDGPPSKLNSTYHYCFALLAVPFEYADNLADFDFP